MTHSRWQQIEGLFYEARQRALGERAAFLAEVCADDDELCRAVYSLLAQDTSTPGPLDRCAWEGLTEPFDAGSTPAPLTPGTQLGAYRIDTRVGAGGMGVVYRGYDPRLDRQVAIKLLTADTVFDQHSRERLRREALTAAALNHPFICKIFEIGEHGDMLFLVMEYIPGETLHHRLLNGPLSLPETLRLAGEIAEALQH